MEEEEKRKREKEEENLTPEELRELRKLQEEADLKTALDTLGLDTSALASIDSFNATSKEEFTELSDVLVKRLHSLRAKEEYVNFLDEFVRNLLAPCKYSFSKKSLLSLKTNTPLIFLLSVSSVNIRKVKASIDNLYLEKQKMEKGDKPKKKSNVKVKAKIRVEEDVSLKLQLILCR